MRKFSIPESVETDIGSICDQGATHLELLNRPMIIEVAKTLGYDGTARWLQQEVNRKTYLEWLQWYWRL